MKMIPILEKIITKIESVPLTFPRFLATITALVIIRIFLEGFSSPIFDIPNYTALLLVSPLFYLNAILAFMILLFLFTRLPLQKLAPFSLLGFLVIFIPPLIDLFSDKKWFVPALLVDTGNVGEKFFTFLIDTSQLSLTWGARLQLILLIGAMVFFVALKTRKIWKAILSGVIFYAVVFVLTAIVSLVAMAILSLQKGVWEVSTLEILDWLVNSRDSLLIAYADANVYSSFLIALIFIPLLLIQSFIFYRLISPKKFRSLLTAIRPTRWLTQIFLFGAGAFFAFSRLENTGIFSPQFILSLIAAGSAILFSWLFGVFLNDIADADIDRVTNPQRPIPRGIISVTEMRNLAIVAGLITFFSSFVLGYKTFFIFLVILAIGYLYSTPPLRLKKWLFFSNLAMGATGALMFTAGYLMFNANNSLVNLPPAVSLLVFVATTLLASVKDLKDYAGDKVGGAYTALTVWGEKKGKLVIALMAFAAIMLFPLILRRPDLFWISLGFGAAEIFIILDKRSRELWVFGTIFIYVFLVYLIAF